ncbi:MAG: hypothetical protein KF726_13970, partial [Anaerolineae bacterium]|nr:hypothetical protein [Anaerolineae bacterium]
MGFMRFLLITIALVLLLCIPSSTSFAQPATYTVANTNDSGAGSLRQAILDANANAGADTIVFQAGLTGTITLTSRLNISDDVTINGPGKMIITIDGNNATRLIYNSATTAISGLTLAHGNGAQGAGIENLGLLTLRDMTLRDHYATFYGAAIMNGDVLNEMDASLTIVNCNFENNRVQPTDSYHAGAAIFSFAMGSIHIASSSFTANQAYDGSALYLFGRQQIDIVDSSFTNNQANFVSVIHVADAYGIAKLDILRTHINQNISTETTAIFPAVFISGATVNITDSTINDNSGSGVFIGRNFERSTKATIQRTALINNGSYALRTSILTAILSNVTVYGPFGIDLESTTTTIYNTTISSVDVGIKFNDTTVALYNSIITRRAVGATYACLAGSSITDGGNNIQYPGTACGGVTVATVNPLLNAPMNNGGSTLTMSLQADSPAIDAGNNAVCAADPVQNMDQRQVVRPIDGNGDNIAVCDIGAFEAGLASPTPTSTLTASPTP